MEEEILSKVKYFLENNPLEKECQVVYFMVELRKILEHERPRLGDSNYPLLKFYCDWTLHVKIERIPSIIMGIINNIYQESLEYIEHGGPAKNEIASFFNMKQLKEEMQEFLKEHSLKDNLTNRENWAIFLRLLVAVIENQPLLIEGKDSARNIESLCFKPASKPGFMKGIIYFKNPIQKYSHFEIMGVF